MITQNYSFFKYNYIALSLIEYCRRFCTFVLKQIHSRLLAKEQDGHVLSRVRNWVPQEAVELKYLPGYGTFDEALVQCVEEKVKPIWADLIFEMDLNQNLLLIDDNNYFLDLWLNFLEVVCSSSKEVSSMAACIDRCKFPFSQHIIVMVDDIVKESSSQGKFTFNSNFGFSKAIYLYKM